MGDAEVVDERPVALDGLGPDAGPRADDVGRTDVGDVALRAPHVGALGERAAHLGDAGAPVLAGHPPEARPGHDVPHVAGAYAGALVALAAQGQHGVRPHLELTGHPAGEVHAEEGVLRIRHRVDHPAHEVALGGRDGHVLAPERHDPGPRLGIREDGQPVGLEPCADDESVDRLRSRRW